MADINQADRLRLQAHLRSALGSKTLILEASGRKGGSVQLRVGEDVLGTVDQVDEEGERSWAVTLIVLQEDIEP